MRKNIFIFVLIFFTFCQIAFAENIIEDENQEIYLPEENLEEEVVPIYITSTPTTDVAERDMGLFRGNVVLGIGSKKMYIDGEIEMIDVSPIIQEGRTLVPVRVISEAFDAEVNYYDESKTAVIKYGKNIIQITAWSNIIEKNNKDIEIDVPATIYQDRMMLPLRKIAELLNKDIHYSNYTIIIGEKIFFSDENMNKLGSYVLPVIEEQDHVAHFIGTEGRWVIFERNNVYTKVKLGTDIFYKIDLETENVYELVAKRNEVKANQFEDTDDTFYEPIKIGEVTYYIRYDNNYLGRYEKESIPREKVLIEYPITDFDIENGFIYFNIYGDNALYKTDLNGQGIFAIIN